jgi:hypothetical protein
MTFFRALFFGLGAMSLCAFGSGVVSAAPYQQSKTGVCGSAATCQISFSAVPAGKTVELTNVSCYVSMSAGAGVKKLQVQQVLASNTAGVSATLVVAPMLVAFGTSSQADLGMVNAPITLFATGGQKFRARVDVVGGTIKEFACHVAGKI